MTLLRLHICAGLLFSEPAPAEYGADQFGEFLLNRIHKWPSNKKARRIAGQWIKCLTTHQAGTMGRKDMTLFVVAKAGVFRYDPDAHALEPVAAGDHRSDTGAQPFVAQAAVNLVFVQDMALWNDSEQSRRQGEAWGYVHTGAMIQNAYLHAASRNWSAVVRGLFDGDKLKAL